MREMERGGAESSGKWIVENLDLIIVCAGPRGEEDDPNWEDERYWAQPAEPSNRDGDTAAAITYAKVGGETPSPSNIILATNTAEILTHTHLLKAGQVVHAQKRTDRSNPAIVRYVFCMMPLLIILWLGGQFSAVASFEAKGVAGWRAGAFEFFNSVPADDSMTFSDLVFFQGELWGCGSFVLADAATYKLIRWDELAGQWVGVTGHGYSDIRCLLVADLGDGEALYIGGGTGVSKYDGATFTALPHGTAFNALCLVVWDDGTGKALYAGGVWDAASACWGIGRWTGTAWIAVGTGHGLGETTADPYPTVWGMAVHDDGQKEVLLVVGNILRAEAVTLQNAGRWNGVEWTSPGGGITLNAAPSSGAVALAVHSHKGVAYAGGAKCAGSPLLRLDGDAWSECGDTLRQYINSGTYGEEARLLAMCSHQGSLWTAGLWHKRMFGFDGLTRRSLCDLDSDGKTWLDMDGGAQGTVRALCIFEGELIATGSFLRIGTIEANNIARWKGTTRTFAALGLGLSGAGYCLGIFKGNLLAGGNFVRAGEVEACYLASWDKIEWSSPGMFNGPIYGMAITADGEKAFFVGRFDHAGGGAGHLCAVEWNGAIWTHVINAIEQVDDDPCINACCIIGDYLYAVGRFNSINGTTCNNIAKMWIPGRYWAAVTVSGVNGLTGEPRTVAEFDGDLYVGGVKLGAGGVTGTTALLKLDISATTWSKVTPTMHTLEAVNSLHGTATKLYVGCRGKSSAMAVYAGLLLTYDGSAWAALGDPKSCFDGEVLAVVVGNAGGGSRPFAGGAFNTLVAPDDFAELAEMLIARLDDKNHFHHVSGGAGLNPWILYALGENSGTIEKLVPLAWHDLRCRTLFWVGNFGLVSERYGRSLCGLTPRGLMGLQGGLIPEADENATPYVILPLGDGRAIIAGGWIAGATNEIILEDDKDDVDYAISSPNAVLWDGFYLRALPGLGGHGHIYCACLWGDLPVLAGAMAPRSWDEETQTAALLIANITSDAGENDLRVLVVYNGELFLAGTQLHLEDVDEWHFVARWSSGNAVGDDPLDWVAAYAAVVDDLGEGESLYLCGQSLDRGPIRRRDATGWHDGPGYASIGGGIRDATVFTKTDGTKLLIVVGALTILVDGDWVYCQAASWDGTTWSILAYTDGYQTILGVKALNEENYKRVILVGEFAKLGKSDGTWVQCVNLAQWTELHGIEAMREGGTNAQVTEVA